jgi:hypothetical protein
MDFLKILPLRTRKNLAKFSVRCVIVFLYASAPLRIFGGVLKTMFFDFLDYKSRLTDEFSRLNSLRKFAKQALETMDEKNSCQ